MCLDMRGANKAIVRERYPIPTVNLQGINGCGIFNKLDLKRGNDQLEITPESQEITMFAVCNRVYRYKRLIFSVSVGTCVQLEIGWRISLPWLAPGNRPQHLGIALQE